MPVTNVYKVYVIRNTAGKFYIGLSENVQIRLQQHNQGISKWTRHRGPWSLVWTSESLSLSDARKLENRLKRQKGGVGFSFLTGRQSLPAHNPAGRDRWSRFAGSSPRNQFNPARAGFFCAQKSKRVRTAMFLHTAGTLNMIPLLNESAYIWSKLCQF
jgi:putative endonuclease